MKTFKDGSGREWTISITVTAVERVRTLADFDLYGVTDNKMQVLAQLMGDPVRFIRVLYAICKPQTEQANITSLEQFGDLFYGDSLAASADAFLEELSDFFPNPRGRMLLKQALAAARAVQGRLQDHAEKLLNELNVETMTDDLIRKYGESPASSELTPVP